MRIGRHIAPAANGSSTVGEPQAVQPIVNLVEMAQERRSCSAIECKLAAARPIALARRLPPDITAAIARAIAAYERTLMADKTPWDAWNDAGRAADSPIVEDFAVFRGNRCDTRHLPPRFTN